MKKKQNYNNVLKILFYISPVVFTIGLFAFNNTIEDFLDKKYTTEKKSKKLFMQRISNLSDMQEDKFILGFSFYKTPWVQAPSTTTARDGLGPLYSSNTCISCHPYNLKSNTHNKSNISRGYVTRLSIPSNNSKKHQKYLKYMGYIPEPVYGSQISINGTRNVIFEAKAKIVYENKIIKYSDGEEVILKKPSYKIENSLQNLNYGALHKDTIITKRLAPALIGLGLLEQISDEQILENEDINDKNNDGISGKANIVYSNEFNDFRIGRYTYKASTPSIIHQSAAAAINDMGLTNYLFKNENCTSYQTDCLNAPKGYSKIGLSKFDLSKQRLEAIAFYLKSLKIPKSIITQKNGEKLFKQISCAKCHIPKYNLKNKYTIKPFTDLLLHDMGDDLSDGRVEFRASKNEWRTSTLWGIGKQSMLNKNTQYLHDGRASSIEEAILWHGGEAQKAKNNFMDLSKENRSDLIKYIKEL